MRLTAKWLTGLFLAFLVLLTVVTGLIIGKTRTLKNQGGGEFGEKGVALPTNVLDVKGRLITQFFSNEQRSVVSLRETSPVLQEALIAREDQSFFHHHGFSMRGTGRAVANLALGRYVSGGSTVTQQLAGVMYDNRSLKTVMRKLRELFWAFQLERALSKQEILANYMNRMYFGHNTYGVQASSQFYFGHPASQDDAAEAAILVIQLASPAKYSPIRHPNVAAKIQKDVLYAMANRGIFSRGYAQKSYKDYWANYDWSRSNQTSAFFTRKDLAPYFSEYVREILPSLLPKGSDIYKDGYTVHTSLNLDLQHIADNVTKSGLKFWNKRYRSSQTTSEEDAYKTYRHFLYLMGMTSALPGLVDMRRERKALARSYLSNDIAPMLTLLSLGTPSLDGVSDSLDKVMKQRFSDSQKSTVETAFVVLNNKTGDIAAMVGGSGFRHDLQLNRVTNAYLMPGSSFKPLYYSAGIDQKIITPATRLDNSPTVFTNPDGTTYTPNNYGNVWSAPVSVRDALAHSLNVPAVHVLQKVGFDNAVSYASKLLGVTDPRAIRLRFPHLYPLALGVVTVSPLELARAYGTIENDGVGRKPLAVMSIADSKGNLIEDLQAERDALPQDRVLSSGTSFIMRSMLHSTVTEGTLSYFSVRRELFRSKYPHLMSILSGKTGTTQNWQDAWAAGFSPFYTAVLWVGFDKRGNSLGTDMPGSIAAGPFWGRFMAQAHNGLPPVKFKKPDSVVGIMIDPQTGMLPASGHKSEIEYFLRGTQPNRVGHASQVGASGQDWKYGSASGGSATDSIEQQLINDMNIVSQWKTAPPSPAAATPGQQAAAPPATPKPAPTTTPPATQPPPLTAPAAPAQN